MFSPPLLCIDRVRLADTYPTVILMAARASRTENPDDPKKARAGVQEIHFLPFNPADKRTVLTYLDGAGRMHRVSKGAPEQNTSMRS
ncbi:unnamed protein product [Urochloa humidicola]